MTTSNERFQKGLETRQRLAGGQGEQFPGSYPAVYELVPDLYRIVTECLYGFIWNRPGLDVRHRIMVTITAAAALRENAQARSAIDHGLNVGLTPQEIVEILIMNAFYNGIPASYTALALAKEVFKERNIDFVAPEHFDPTVSTEARYQAGMAKHGELMQDVFGYYSADPTPEERGPGRADHRVPLGVHLDTPRAGYEEPDNLHAGVPGSTGALRPDHPSAHRGRPA